MQRVMLVCALTVSTGHAAEPLPYPKAGVGLGIGIGTFEIVPRARVDRAVFEPIVGFDAQLFGGASASPFVGDGDRQVDADAVVGLDIRGVPHLTRRWEVGVIGGVMWRGQFVRTELSDGDIETRFGQRLDLRAGAGFGFRPGPKSTIGLDLVASLVGIRLQPSRVIGEDAPEETTGPGVSVAPSLGLRLLWTFWAGERVPVEEPEAEVAP